MFDVTTWNASGRDGYWLGGEGEAEDQEKADKEGDGSVAQVLSIIQANYAPYHGFASIGVCLVGSVCSLLVVAVLTRRHMMSATSFLLAALAVSDLLTMLVYVPFALQFYCLYGVEPSRQRNARPWAYFCLFYANFSVTTHTVSIWICVVLAAYRYRCVRRSAESAGGAGRRKSVRGRGAGMGEESVTFSKISLACVVLGSCSILVPNYASLGVTEKFVPGLNATIYEVVESADHPNLNSVNFWIHALLVKLLPCLLMSVFGGLLLMYVRRLHNMRSTLHQPAEAKRMLLKNESAKTTRVENVENKVTREERKDADAARESAVPAAAIDAKPTGGDSNDVRLISSSIPAFSQVFVAVAKLPETKIQKECDKTGPKEEEEEEEEEKRQTKITLVENLHRRARNNDVKKSSIVVHSVANERAKARKSDHQRTTGMLCAVLVLFLVTELPQGILALVCGLEPGYYPLYYTPLGDVMDIVALVNNAVNFILYCATSRQFRSTFWSMIVCKREPHNGRRRK